MIDRREGETRQEFARRVFDAMPPDEIAEAAVAGAAFVDEWERALITALDLGQQIDRTRLALFAAVELAAKAMNEAARSTHSRKVRARLHEEARKLLNEAVAAECPLVAWPATPKGGLQ